MSHFAIVNIIPKDNDLLAQYRSKAFPHLVRHNATVVAAGPNKVLEDNGAGPLGLVVISFPDEAAAQAWFDDPEIAEIHALRNKAAHSSIVLVPEFQAA